MIAIYDNSLDLNIKRKKKKKTLGSCLAVMSPVTCYIMHKLIRAVYVCSRPTSRPESR